MYVRKNLCFCVFSIFLLFSLCSTPLLATTIWDDGEPGSNLYGNGKINGLFLDYSARNVGLKELWEYKWHKSYDSSVFRPYVWPEWMKKYKGYN